MNEAVSPPPRKKNYAWAWYFAFLVIASVGAMVFMIWYNNLMQLKPEELAAAKRRWQEANIKNYDMIYLEKHNEDKSTKFAVKVRNSKVQDVLMNGKPLEKSEERADDPRIYHSMDSMYRNIDRFMDLDQKPKATPVYVTLKWDEKNGAVIEYIRRVMGTRQRVQIVVEKFVPVEN